MPTTSIKRNIIISDNESAERFIDALETSSQNPRKPSNTNVKTLKKGEISKIFEAQKK